MRGSRGCAMHRPVKYVSICNSVKEKVFKRNTRIQTKLKRIISG